MKITFNPFTSKLDLLGNSSSGVLSVPEVDTDPVSPAVGDMWVLKMGDVGSPGLAMGVLGLTYSRAEVSAYQLSIKMTNGDIKRINLL